MRKLPIFISLMLASFSSFNISGQDLSSNPVQQAIMDTYDRLIKEDPTDFEPYFRRASDYYRMNQYLRALSDVDEALKLTPADRTDMRYAELVLRANIYLMTDRPAEASADFEAALQLDPTNFNTIHQKANTDFILGNIPAAKAGFIRMQGLSPRSPEALFGLARIAIKERNYGQANEYADKAVQLNAGESSVYVTRANIRQELGNNTAAAQDLIAAISIDANGRALGDLIALGGKDYPATSTALSEAIKEAPQVEMFKYLRAEVAMINYHYKDAIKDFNTLIEGNTSSPGIYQALAQCHYALGNYAQAAVDIEFAISATADNADFYVNLSQIRRAQWREEDALEAAEKALAKDPSHVDAMEQKALALVDLKKYTDASTAIGEAILNDGDDPLFLLERAWILTDFLNQPGAAKNYCNRVIALENTTEPLTDFAHLFNGDKKKGEILLEAQIAANTKDPHILYLATCFYAQAGEKDKALDYMGRALEAGYANYHDWNREDIARINCAPIRDEKRFNELLTQYKSIF